LVKLSWPTWFVLISVTIVDALLLGVFIVWRDLWAATVMLGITVGSLIFWYYSTWQRKRRVQYPIVPPEGKPDIYFPRTRIPRPIHEDFRKIDERKRKLKKLRKMMRRRD
jgi:hypothetical protein